MITLKAILAYLFFNSVFTYNVNIDAKIDLKNQDLIEMTKHIITVPIDLNFDESSTIYYIPKVDALNGRLEVEYSKIDGIMYSDIGLDKNLVIHTVSGVNISALDYIISTDLNDLRKVLSCITDNTMDLLLDFNKQFYIIIDKDM